MRRTAALVKLFCFCCLLCGIGTRAKAQWYPVPASTPVLLDSMYKSKPDTGRVLLLMEIASHFGNQPGSYPADYDSCMLMLNHALRLCDTLHNVAWHNKVMLLKGRGLIENGERVNGNACFMEVINYELKAGNKSAAARAWMKFGMATSETEDQLNAYSQARALYRAAHDTLQEALAFKAFADIHLNMGELDLAETELLQVLSLVQKLHYKKVYDVHYLLAALYRLKGDLHKELYYDLETLKGMEAAHDSIAAGLFYLQAGETYEELHMYPQSLEYFEKSFNSSVAHSYNTVAYMALSRITAIFLTQNKKKEALSYLQAASKDHPTKSLFQKRTLAKCFGNCYEALDQYGLAEKYYQEMILYSDSARLKTILSPEDHARDYTTICDFYIQRNQYKKAVPYLDTLLAFHDARVSPVDVNHIRLLKFRVDSAAGNYLSAIHYFQAYTQINDSLFNAAKSKQISELEIKYETNQKDKNIQLQSQNILLLKKQTQIERAQAEKTKVTRNLMFISSVMLLLLLGVGYNRYRLKQRSNLQLQAQQKEIAAKNSSLEQLLRDNEWLLKEVHHRVKNNLQIVMSLLSSQTAYLEDETALSAVMDSQHRVQAMSLIHQKLYKSDNVANIYMPEYINDLIDYLKDSFETKHCIYFEQQIEPIVLDTVRAVPLGLILNELITNAMKYAFNHSEKDNKVSVQLFVSAPEEITLIVSDNGRGLPADLDFEKSNSFGIVLIKGLTEDLGGIFKIESKDGTRVEMVFNNKPLFKGGLQSVV